MAVDKVHRCDGTRIQQLLSNLLGNALMHGLETYDRRHGWRGAWGRVNIVSGWEAACR